ncbi:putative methyltransferase-domain-containing protein [Auriculariales sp. MPI-PUGE-AT-0066]|nr:putative methyltransferase-domain-containing protein [Auriculariales sp. MPI-PUGE-AT-0066]
MSDPEDFLADSFPELTQRYVAVAIGDHRQLYTHPATGIQLSPPDTLAKNWQLHANSIWAASIFLADHLHEIGLEDLPRNARVLELGAGAGLPGIAIAKATPDAQVWLSDYPDDNILRRLQDNAVRNQLESRCRVVGHIWGSRDLAWPSEPLDSFDELANSFDLIIAADTLWNVDSQELFIQSLLTFLKGQIRVGQRVRVPFSVIATIGGLAVSLGASAAKLYAWIVNIDWQQGQVLLQVQLNDGTRYQFYANLSTIVDANRG